MSDGNGGHWPTGSEKPDDKLVGADAIKARRHAAVNPARFAEDALAKSARNGSNSRLRSHLFNQNMSSERHW
jgi:hypothetical protein